MRIRQTAVTALAVGLLGTGTAVAAKKDGGKKDGGGHNRQAVDTRAVFTPGETFTPLAASTTCPGAGLEDPFAIGPELRQAVFAAEPEPPKDEWDMHTQNESGTDAGRYVYRTHEQDEDNPDDPAEPQPPAESAGLSVTDLRTGESRVLAERNDWERFDGIVWTPWGTILAAEEVREQDERDPQVPQAVGGLVYEFFVDPDDPSRLDPSREPIRSGDGTSDTTRDGIRARPALGAKSHEGLRFDWRGYLYGIAETRGESQGDSGQSGGVFRFVPDRKGDLASGRLSALRTEGGRYGEGTWVALDREAVQVDADAEAVARGANRYERPEDVETDESTGRDANNGGHTLYVAITAGSAEGVMAVDLTKRHRPHAYPYVGKTAGNAAEPAFDMPDNLALDRAGNLAITEDPGGEPPAKTRGDDVWVATPPRGGKHRRPAAEVARLASLRDCAAEPSGIYFAMATTDRWTDGGPLEGLVTGRSLLVHRMHAGQDVPNDESVAITPGPR